MLFSIPQLRLELYLPLRPTQSGLVPKFYIHD